jgi:hypothetical protein
VTTFIKLGQYRFVLGLAATLGALAVLAAPAAAKPAVDEYTLDIPSPKGDKKFNPYKKSDRGGSGGGGFRAGGGGGSLSPAIEQRLAGSASGAALTAVATDPALGAPERSDYDAGLISGQGQGGSGSDSGGAGSGGSGEGGESLAAAGELSPDPPGAFAAMTGSGGEVVPTLGLVFLVLAGIGGLLLYLRRRGSLPGSGG